MTRPKKHEAFGARLQNARRRREWTQGELARRSAIPLTMIESYEQGRSLPSAPRLAILCDLLNVTAEELLPRPWSGSVAQ